MRTLLQCKIIVVCLYHETTTKKTHGYETQTLHPATSKRLKILSSSAVYWLVFLVILRCTKHLLLMTNIQQSILCLIRQIEQDYKIYAFIEFIDGNMSLEFAIPSDYSAAGIYACKINGDASQSYVKQRHIFNNLQRIIEGVPANTKLDQYTLKK